MLRDKRCDIAQGFLYSPARPVHEVAALIARIEGVPPPSAGAGDPDGSPAADARPVLSLARAS